jgi:hypothetical protein
MRAATHNQTHSFNWQTGTHLARAIDSAIHRVARASATTLAVSAILFGAIWAGETWADTGVVQAVIWASSLVFLALAIDSSADQFKPLLTTGLLLGVLAFLATPEAIGFTILAAAIISAWVAWAILGAFSRSN